MVQSRLEDAGIVTISHEDLASEKCLKQKIEQVSCACWKVSASETPMTTRTQGMKLHW